MIGLYIQGYGRPGGLIPRDPSLGIPHPADLLGRQYGDQIAHQVMTFSGEKLQFFQMINVNYFEKLNESFYV